MIWRLFTRSTRPSRDDAWWHAAEQAAEVGAPDADAVARLREAIPAEGPLDETELQEEMLDGLEQLQAMTAAPDLPVLETQHRVIGTDVCHFATPATLDGEQAVPGKLFLTSRRLVFAGGRAQSWPWHRVRAVTREGRLVTVGLGGNSGIRLQCNSFGDAMTITWLSDRLTPSPSRTGSDGR